MTIGEPFWKLDSVSDEQLLAGLHAALRSNRRSTAELVAHLAEVEERRLHLRAASSSMFHYCVARLGLSEDEACRRIDAARLARRYPAIFPMLESGKLSLTVLALLKPHLTANNHTALLDSVRAASVQRAREIIAAFAPQPDVPSTIRKQPQRHTAVTLPPVVAAAAPINVAASPPPAPITPDAAPSVAPDAIASSTATHAPIAATPVATTPIATTPIAATPIATTPIATTPIATTPIATTHAPIAATHAPIAATHAPIAATPIATTHASITATHAARPAQTIEPLAPARYKIQFTAGAELKAKLELARDLMRHAHPSGDFALIFERALDLLIASQLKRRFGASSKSRGDASAEHRDDVSAKSRDNASTMNRDRASPKSRSDANATHRNGSSSESSGGVSAAQREGANAEQREGVMTTAESEPTTVEPTTVEPTTAKAARTEPATTEPAAPSRIRKPLTHRPHVPRTARRAVLERHGLSCSWVDERGTRCNARAWLEIDHENPHALGGSSEAANLRLLCRAHNRLAAERTYGRAHVEQCIARRQT